MKRYFLTLFAVIVSMAANAQQWEIDCKDLGNYSFLATGIVNDQGEAVVIGQCGPDKSHYFPVVIRVTEDGEYDYRIFDTIGNNVKPTHIVQLDNGTYFASAVVQPDDIGMGEDVLFMLLDSDFNLLNVKTYEKPEMVLGMSGGRALLHDDGTVVFVCGYWHQTVYGRRSKPCFYRLDENADTLANRFVIAELPDPEGSIGGADFYQVLNNPNGDGIVVLCGGINNTCSLLMYDYDFNYENGFQLYPAFRQHFETVYSDHWISNDKLLIMGDMWPYEEYNRWHIGMAEVGLDGTFGRWDRVYHKQDTAIQVPNPQCMAYVNDTTIYGGSWFYASLGGVWHPSVCLYDTDMELLGRKEFVEAEYGDRSTCCFILPMLDGECLVGMYCTNIGYSTTHGKLIKMSRNDFNPIPCSVKEMPEKAIKALAYPNPAGEELNIDISGLTKHDEHRIRITDALGCICMDRIIRGEGNVLTVGVSGLKAGVYVYSIYNAEKEIVRNKFIKE